MGKYREYKKSGLNSEQNGFYVARKKMVEAQIMKHGVTNERVLKAMREIPRHLFVPKALWDQAYSDYPVNIGEGQTISQPLIVAMMTELLDLKGDEKVLEIGTGSGYQAAVLCDLCGHLYTIERIRSLANSARKSLYEVGFTNFTLRVGDGTKGWKEEAPFDCIIVTAGAPDVPKVYLEQLSDRGRLVIPVGDEYNQSLIVFERTGDDFRKKAVSGCRFVKLIGKHGWKN